MVQKDLDQFIEKLVSFVLYARRFAMKYQYNAANITDMDETPVWANIGSATTVENSGKKQMA